MRRPTLSLHRFPDELQTRPPLVAYLTAAGRYRVPIVCGVLVCTTAAFVLSRQIAPQYEAFATVDVDRQAPEGVVGQANGRPPWNDADQFLATQVKRIQSGAVLAPAIRAYGLRPVDLRVTRPPNTYLLQIGYRANDARRAADIANAVARSFLEQSRAIRQESSSALSESMAKQLAEMHGNMERSAAKVARFDREFDMVDPEQRTSLLSARLQQLNTEYTAAHGDRIRKEAIRQAVDGGLAAVEASTQGDALKGLRERLGAARQRFAEIETHYGVNHPEYRKAAAQLRELEDQLRRGREDAAQRIEVEYREAAEREEMLRKSLAKTKEGFDRLNGRSFEYQSLRRDAEADQKLYGEVAQRAKESRMNGEVEIATMRIAELARPPVRPVYPDVPLNTTLVFIFSALIAVMAAGLRDQMDGNVRDAGSLAALRYPILATLPLVKAWRKRAADSADTESGAFEESIRELRNALAAGAGSRPLRTILITSAARGEGKTTAAAHLAQAFARRERRTLLIDANLRSPGAAGKLGIHAETGLAGAMLPGGRWRQEVIRLAELPNLDILPAGPSDATDADLAGLRLPEILQEARTAYSVVLIDAAPVLGFAETVEIAAAADGVIVMARAGATSREALMEAVGSLEQGGGHVLGVVLNEIASVQGVYHRISRKRPMESKRAARATEAG